MLNRRPGILPVLLVLALCTATAAADELRNIRTTDRRLRALIDEGARTSLTFRALVRRIERSDVVVYVRCEGDGRTRIAGRLTFVSAAGGRRYVAVRMVRLPRAQQIAILGHELQHAVEIAEDPSIVDGPSLARAYLRIGHLTGAAPSPVLAFDTQAAIVAGRQVLEELGGSGE